MIAISANKLFDGLISNTNVKHSFKPIQDEGAKKHPYQFSLVTSTNVGVSPQNLITFSFNPFATLV